MTDREMIELAARAAGGREYKSEYMDAFGLYWSKEGEGAFVIDENGGINWNPLTSDADRYRLAEKLKLRIDFSIQIVTISDSGVFVCWPEDEPSAARAITRAAAEIGRGMV
jgi:hypothetical protein